MGLELEPSVLQLSLGSGRGGPKAAPPFLGSTPILAITHTLSTEALPGYATTHTSHRLVIEDAKGPEVTLQVLSDSLLQVTLRSKLYLSLQR